MTDLVTGCHWYASPDTFPDGCLIVTDAATGKQVAHGETVIGARMSLELGVPLCSFCDQPVPDDGFCSSCEVVHSDLAERAELDPRQRPDGRWTVAA